MKGVLSKASLVALVALAMASQGCLVPWAKYISLKRKYDEAVRELAAKDSQLADANTRIDQLRDQLKAKDQLIALYSDKGADADARVKLAREELDRIMQRLKEIQDRNPGVEVVDGTLIIKDQLLFSLGSAEVSEAGKKVLADVASKFKATGETIQIDGHTDDTRVSRPDTVAKFGDNWGLAALRARAVLHILAKEGVAETRMYLRAFSMFRPRLPNTSPDNKGKNRRVEVMFFPESSVQPMKPAEAKPEAPKPEAPKPDAPKTEAPKPAAPAAEPAKPADTK